ncbi:MAG: ECF transporter S component [Oscillospiraceae bacterium]|nr:ECF transporter S component [Oscillospiraceae bacterium]
MTVTAKTMTKKITFGLIIIAAAVLVPQAFHIPGVSTPGELFLPMHIPVIIGGFTLGPVFGLAIGLISPIISHLVTGMPPSFRLPFMILELGAYGFMSGFLYKYMQGKKFGIIITLAATMLFGRLVFALALLAASGLFGLAPPLHVGFAWTATVTGIYGIIIQLAYVPFVIYSLERSGFVEKHLKHRKG